MSRKTKQKVAILRVLKATKRHPTASWVYEQVRQEISNISLGTVYRDLKSLIKEGEISELGPAGAQSRFDGTAENHYHFRCRQCSRIFDVNGPVGRDLDKRLAQKTGFEVSYHRLDFFGLCKDCQS
ncbi:MAG: transcriptional repressor [Dehalococcoidales bacterium]